MHIQEKILLPLNARMTGISKGKSYQNQPIFPPFILDKLISIYQHIPFAKKEKNKNGALTGW